MSPLPPPDLPRPVYLDCDPGVDDALALGVVLARPNVRLTGVGTVCGNTSAAQGADNALRLLALAGRHDVPVAVGSADHLTAPYTCTVQDIHGDNGIGDIELPAARRPAETVDAVDMLLSLSHEHAGTLEVLAIGPLTNLARALERDRALASRVRRVVMMGGSALRAGNATPAAEANVHDDPEAAAVVLSAPWDVTMIGLDVTSQDVLEEDQWERLAASGSPFVRALARVSDSYLDFHATWAGRRCALMHDALAAAVVTADIAPPRRPRAGRHGYAWPWR